MEAETMATDFWAHLGVGAFRTLPLQRWKDLASDEEIESLVRAGVMTDLSDDQLDGRRDRYNFTGDAQSYEIEILDNSVRAIPDGPGSVLSVTREQARVLTAYPDKFLDFLSERNGFVFAGAQRSIGPGVAEIGRISLGGRVVIWMACFDTAALKSPALLSYLREHGNESSKVVVVSMPDPKLWPTDMAWETRVVPAPFPSQKTGWLLDRRIFCSSRLGFSAKAVAEQFWKYGGIDLLIAEQENGMFLFGRDLELKVTERAFQYVTCLVDHALTEIRSDTLVQTKYKNYSDPQQALYDDQGLLRDAIKRAIKDGETQAKALALFKNTRRGFLHLPLGSERILRWQTRSP